MTTINSNEHDERLKQIRERWATALPNVFSDDINFLLSIVDSLISESFMKLVNKEAAAETAATRMRDKCVRKVRELEAAWLGDSRTEANDDRSNAAYEKCCAARVIATALSSLTLDQVEQKQS